MSSLPDWRLGVSAGVVRDRHRAPPWALFVETFGTGVVPDERLEDAIQATFDLRPAAIIRDLDLKRPIYARTAAYGHFGRQDMADFTWERTDRVAALQAAVE